MYDIEVSYDLPTILHGKGKNSVNDFIFELMGNTTSDSSNVI